MVFVTLLLIPVFALGWVLLYAGVNQYRTKMLIEDTPTSTARAISLGMVELQGSPEPFEESYEAPFSKDEVVLYRYHVDKWRQDSDSKEGGDWLPVEVGTRPSRFYLNDGTARVLIDPAEAEVDLRRETYELEAGESEPEEVRSFLAERDERFENETDLSGWTGTVPTFLGEEHVRKVGDFSMADGAAAVVGDESRKRRYVEESLPVDEDDVYVFGYAKSREGVSSPDNPENVVVENDDRLPTYRIANKSEEEVIDQTGSLIWKTLGAGALITGFVYLWMLVSFGPLGGTVLALILAPLSIGFAVVVNQFVDLGKTRMKTGG